MYQQPETVLFVDMSHVILLPSLVDYSLLEVECAQLATPPKGAAEVGPIAPGSVRKVMSDRHVAGAHGWHGNAEIARV